MDLSAILTPEAIRIIGADLGCGADDAAVRLAAIAEHLRAAAFAGSALSVPGSPWEPVGTLRLTSATRDRLSAVWPDVMSDGTSTRPGVLRVLNNLAELGDIVRLDGGLWLPAPPRLVGVDAAHALLLGGGPLQALPCPLPSLTRATGLARVVDVSTAAPRSLDHLAWQDLRTWLAAQPGELELWTAEQLTRLSSTMERPLDDLGSVRVYLPRGWVPLSDLTCEDGGLRLCRRDVRLARNASVAYWLAEIAPTGTGARLERVSEVGRKEARRLQYGLDAVAGRSLYLPAQRRGGIVALTLPRPIPAPEAKLLFLGWRGPSTRPDRPWPAQYLFAEALLPLLRRVLAGLGVRVG